MSDVEDLLTQAKDHYAARNFSEALRICEHLKEAAPQRPEPHNIIGKVHYSQMNYIEALKHFEQAQGVDPGHINSAWNAGNALFYLRRLGEAVSFYKRVLELDGPDHLHQQARTMIAHIERVSGVSGAAAGR